MERERLAKIIQTVLWLIGNFNLGAHYNAILALEVDYVTLVISLDFIALHAILLFSNYKIKIVINHNKADWE